MRFRPLNNTGIELSVLGFGCKRLPVIDHKQEQIDYVKASQMLHRAIEFGVNFVDTAYFYHAALFGQRGESEPFLGEALSAVCPQGLGIPAFMKEAVPLFKD